MHAINVYCFVEDANFSCRFCLHFPSVTPSQINTSVCSWTFGGRTRRGEQNRGERGEEKKMERRREENRREKKREKMSEKERRRKKKRKKTGGGKRRTKRGRRRKIQNCGYLANVAQGQQLSRSLDYGEKN